ncbi:uncharacterized protein LOC110652148 isoform X3 [Hevea brasiliensis]|uniref:uncharacterized protein LOC110652148 isoform X3 n=1 Tax=Hevea brasiliensis TaxID=3981 RepID=UPI000B781B24|nr:uncharacterized protein LOC110652148 isoform X3 [Hevea brasiliensis]XP_058009982.1 uncharacterized protein LOC110652148 isoform X3 [Hevea brasiliensis]XP_058009983.1 uncharacterized protein LOC110652148 isoform X3 [Hevea brasiliensis]
MAAPSFASLPLWELILIQENDGGRTTLHYASSEGWFKKINLKDKACCSHLIRHGADADVEDKGSRAHCSWLSIL